MPPPPTTRRGKRCRDYLNWHIDAANRLGKPIVLEEFGINRDGGSYSPGATTVFRDRFYGGIYGLLARRAAAGDAIAGSNFWAWNGAGRTHNADFYWRAGDAFVGDPPQEPQGLYGVFDSDKSTIAIVSPTPGSCSACTDPVYLPWRAARREASGDAGPAQRSMVERSAVSEKGLAR
jgi:endo-1,4-beta-mannosidase